MWILLLYNSRVVGVYIYIYELIKTLFFFWKSSLRAGAGKKWGTIPKETGNYYQLNYISAVK